MQNTLVEKIVEAVKEERLKDIADATSPRSNAQTRIVLELAADPNVVENQLYQHTPLQQTFSIINIARWSTVSRGRWGSRT
ncbi:MAG: hypothetical protein R3B49_04490 [Phycisphaerales bacterium]